MNSNGESLNEQTRPFLVRAVHTPVSDLLRGRVTGRYDVKGLLIRSGLPGFLQDYVFKVVLRTGLWRSEKIVVARELVDRLKGECGCGESDEETVSRLEPWKKAGRRIRREKRRARALLWRVGGRCIQFVSCTIALLALVYGVCFGRFMFGTPTITRNFLAEMTAEAMAVPEGERAWPVYRKAILALEPFPEGLTVGVRQGDGQESEPLGSHGFLHTEPGEEHWGAVLEYIAENGAAMSLVRQAANRSRLGYYLGDTADAVVPSAGIFCDSGGVLVSSVEEENPMVRSVELPHLRHLRFLALLLRADMHRAAREEDAGTVVANMRAMLGIVRHYQDNGLLGHSVFTAAQVNLMCEAAGAVLAENAHCFSDEDLKECAACLERLRPADFCISAGWERAYILDTIQRTYTDNGRGNGYFTRHVSPHLICLCRPLNEPIWEERADSLAVILLLPVLGADRREMERFCTKILDEVEDQAKQPLWKQDEFVLDRRILDLSSYEVVRYAPAFFMLRWFSQGDFLIGEFSRQRYDAVRVAIALEQYRRKTGGWPERLEELTPDLLPAVPYDRFDGGPIKYCLENDQPVLYSIGVDRVDDGGVVPDDEHPCPDVWVAPSEVSRLRGESWYRGDWVLWPPMRR